MTWIDREKRGTLNTRLPPSPQYSSVEKDDEVVEVKRPEQAPSADAGEEEEAASNPSVAEDEPVPITLDEAPLANVKEEEPDANTADDAHPA